MKRLSFSLTAKAFVPALFASVALFGCDSDGASDSLSMAQFAKATATEFCHQAISCTEAGDDGTGYAVMAGANIEACADAFKVNLNITTAAAWVADGQATYDPKQAAKCVAAYGAGGCTEGLAVEACLTVLTGLVPPGGACADDVVCAGVARCDKGDGPRDCAGVCKPLKALGEACLSAMDCAGRVAGVECDFNSKVCVETTPAVKETAAAGEACGWFGSSEGTRVVSCASGFVCSEGDGEDDVCVPVLKKGADCTGLGVCALGLVCTGTEAAAVCETLTIARTVGADCNETDSTKAMVSCNRFERLRCDAANKCVKSDGTTGSFCDPLMAPCNSGLYCHRQTEECAPLLAVGAPCGSSDACGSGYCGSSNVCADLVCE